MNFDGRTEKERKNCEKIYKATEDLACDLIYYCRADSMNDVEFALGERVKKIQKKIKKLFGD